MDNYCGKKYERVESVKKLKEVLQEAWNAVPIELIMEDIASMPERLQEVIDKAGGFTKMAESTS